MRITWVIKHFNELNTNEYFDALQLRTEVFVVEQNCPYQEVDDKDKVSYHVLGYKNKDLVAVARILPKGVTYKEISIGRVATKKNYRNQGIASKLIITCFRYIQENFGENSIRISAQKYLVNFYKKHSFKSVGKTYLEDNIPHIEMYRDVCEKENKTL